MHTCSKFSVKCEASHKPIVQVDFLRRVDTYRQVLHLTIIVCKEATGQSIY